MCIGVLSHFTCLYSSLCLIALPHNRPVLSDWSPCILCGVHDKNKLCCGILDARLTVKTVTISISCIPTCSSQYPSAGIYMAPWQTLNRKPITKTAPALKDPQKCSKPPKGWKWNLAIRPDENGVLRRVCLLCSKNKPNYVFDCGVHDLVSKFVPRKPRVVIKRIDTTNLPATQK
jgi:hypothetical protein